MTREGAGWRLYRDTARSQAHNMEGRARGAQPGATAGARALGGTGQAGGCIATQRAARPTTRWGGRGARRRVRQQALGRWAARARSAGTGRAGLGTAWACCWASRLCTQCTQPVLTQFRLSTVPESLNEHC